MLDEYKTAFQFQALLMIFWHDFASKCKFDSTVAINYLPIRSTDMNRAITQVGLPVNPIHGS